MVSTMLLATNSQSRLVPSSPKLEYLDRGCRFRRGDLLALQPKLLWQIDQGFVRTVTWDELGNVVTLGIWGAGEFVGQPLSQLQPYQIECLTEVHAKKLSYVEATSSTMLNHVHQTERLLSIIHCKQTATRLLMLLEWLSQRFGQRIDRGWLLEIKLTHQVISEIIGTTRVTVTRLLRQLEREGKLIRGRKSLILTCSF